MVNIEMLEQEMDEQNITDEEMAKVIKKDLSTWYRRKNAPHTFLIGEIEKIKNALDLSKDKAISIFLS